MSTITIPPPPQPYCDMDESKTNAIKVQSITFRFSNCLELCPSAFCIGYKFSRISTISHLSATSYNSIQFKLRGNFTSSISLRHCWIENIGYHQNDVMHRYISQLITISFSAHLERVKIYENIMNENESKVHKLHRLYVHGTQSHSRTPRSRGLEWMKIHLDTDPLIGVTEMGKIAFHSTTI